MSSMFGQRTQRRAKGAVAGLVLVLGVAGCTERYTTHGWLPPERALQEIVPGLDTRATVEDVVGQPSAMGFQDGGDYYYISTRLRNHGIRRPEVVERDIVAIRFDGNDVVSQIARLDAQDAMPVTLERRVTKGTDRQLSWFRRVFGNIGGVSAGDIVQ